MLHTGVFTKPMPRKKDVVGKYCPNSYRVISTEVEKYPMRPGRQTMLIPDSNVIGQNQDDHRVEDYRKNRPNPEKVNFILTNARLLCEPICTVKTGPPPEKEKSWWQGGVPVQQKRTPPYASDSTMRHDYQYVDGKMPKGSARYSAATKYRTPAKGGVPLTFLPESDGQPRVWREKMSFEHGYDSRWKENYPPRGRRVGSYVYNRVNEDCNSLTERLNIPVRVVPPWLERFPDEENFSSNNKHSSPMQVTPQDSTTDQATETPKLPDITKSNTSVTAENKQDCQNSLN